MCSRWRFFAWLIQLSTSFALLCTIVKTLTSSYFVFSVLLSSPVRCWLTGAICCRSSILHGWDLDLGLMSVFSAYVQAFLLEVCDSKNLQWFHAWFLLGISFKSRTIPSASIASMRCPLNWTALPSPSPSPSPAQTQTPTQTPTSDQKPKPNHLQLQKHCWGLRIFNSASNAPPSS